MTKPKCWVGIDISQEKLDLCWWPSGQFAQYENNHTGIDGLIADLATAVPELVVVEATGGLERLLLSACQAADIAIARVNPRQVKGFAQALGKAKTDALDAKMLAQYAQKMEPQAQVALSATEQQLVDWVRRRHQLVTMQVAEKNRIHRASAEVLSTIQAHIQQLTEAIQAASEQIDKLIAQQPDFPEKRQILRSVKGIGDITTAMLLAELPELGRLTDKQIARLVGVAPINRDSGKHQGKRQIQGGRTAVRTGLYMATLVATRHNPVIRQFYQHLLDKGKLKKVALVACMRKLLVILNAMMRDRKLWQNPKPLTAS